MNLDWLMSGKSCPQCCVCGKVITDISKAHVDVSGYLCEECGEGQPAYSAANCKCESCGSAFVKGWQIPMNMNLSNIKPPNRLTCPKCRQRKGIPLTPADYVAGVTVEGEEEDWLD